MTNDCKVVVIKAPVGAGVSQARNIGLSVSQSDYVAFLDDTLVKCVNEKLMSANDFHDVAKYLSATSTQEESIKTAKPIQSEPYNIQVETRSVDSYTHLLGGVTS